MRAPIVGGGWRGMIDAHLRPQRANAIMNFYSTHYRSGEEIRAGDDISWAGKPGRVVFVLGSSEVPADWACMKEWLPKEDAEGFMLDTEVAGLVFEYESNEDLKFLGRKP
jgi:hypothetical protein